MLICILQSSPGHVEEAAILRDVFLGNLLLIFRQYLENGKENVKSIRLAQYLTLDNKNL